MLGIDLIDLGDPLLKKREANALRLIIHPADTYPKHTNEFWHLWTAKEAVFKAQRDLTSFDPKAIPIQITQEGDHLKLVSGAFSGKIITEGKLIYAIASLHPESISFKVLRKTTTDESREVRSAIVDYFKETHQMEVAVVSDGDGLPILSYQSLPISITHHADYIGFAVPNP